MQVILFIIIILLLLSTYTQVALSVWRDEVNGKKPPEPDSDSEVEEIIPNAAGPSSDDQTQDRPPPTSDSEGAMADDDWDLDAVLKEAEQQEIQTGLRSSPSRNLPLQGVSGEADDDSMWEDIDSFLEADPAPVKKAAPAASHPDEDDDMWDIMDEMERNQKS
jgi:hypothetical protein